MNPKDTLHGVLWMVAGMALFALEDVFIKLSSGHMPPSQVLILLGTSGATAFALLCLARGEPVFSKALFHRAVITRNLCEIAGTSFFVSALVLLPLAVTIAIFQAIPLVVTFGAVLFLGLVVGWRRWTAIFIGFAGVIIIIRPGLDGFQPAALLAVIATILIAVRDLSTRWVPKGISSYQLASYGFASMAISGLILTPFWGAFVLPDPRGWAFLAGAVIFGMSGYYAMTASSRIGDLGIVTPFRYTRILFAILLGIVVFHERPDIWTLFGSGLILASGVYALTRERRAPRRPLSTG